MLITACGDSSGPIADNVVEPGLTAITQARSIACDIDLQTLSVAIQAYTELEGAPPANEQTLIDAQFLREGSEGWDIVDGQIVAANPQCGNVGVQPDSTLVPATAPATTIGQIVSDTEPLKTAEQLLAELTPDDIAGLGGDECARQLMEIFAAGERYVAERGSEPASIDDLVAQGYLAAAPTGWHLDGTSLVGTDGSGCVTPATPSDAEACLSDARTMRVAVQAYQAMNGQDARPTEADLVDAGMLRDQSMMLDLVDNVVVPTLGGPCVGIDISEVNP